MVVRSYLKRKVQVWDRGILSFMFILLFQCHAPFPSPKKSLDQVSDILKNLAGLQESGQTRRVCVLKERILHISNLLSRGYFLIRATGGLRQPSKRKSKAPKETHQKNAKLIQELYAMLTRDGPPAL